MDRIKNKILIVNDQKINRQILVNMLSDVYDTVEAENGAVALEILKVQASSIAAIFLDIVMPILNGYELLEVISTHREFSSIPIIAMTQYGNDEVEETVLAMGARDFIFQPCSPTVLHWRLQHLIEHAANPAALPLSKDQNTGLQTNSFYHDRLTKIYNRIGFYQALNPIVHADSTEQFTLICCNIRNFKIVNELYGSVVGDQLLQSVAAQIYNSGPLACGRLDADRFAFCIHRGRLDIDKLIAFGKNYFSNGEVSFPYSIRFGLYLVKDKHLSVNAMCDRAKAAKRYIHDEYYMPYAIWDESMREEIVNEGIFANELLPALEQNQFVVFYQPIVDAKTQKIVSAEALIRWNHPSKGFISPDKFIPVLEKNASIAKLDLFVGTTVATFIKSRLDTHAAVVPVSINTSRMDFHNHRIAEVVRALLQSMNLPPQYFKMEITESTYAVEPEKILSDVRKLRKLGIQVLLDDFGSGYSSFNSLHNLDIDIIKLDMKFISGFSTNPKCKTILSKMIELAHQLGNKVVSEGVETQEEYEFLRDVGCDYIQGYYFYKPLPENEFILRLNADACAM